MIFTSEVKWIKITTDMFEDDKIDYIQTLPEADAIIVIWVRLLTLAGKCNAGGYIYLTENIPYDPNMLASKFRKPINIVNMALEIFKKLRMIECDDNGFFLTNWEKHQNIDGLEKIKEQNRIRVQNYRQKQKLLKNGNVTGNVTDNVTGNDDVTQGNAIDIELDKDKEIDNISINEVWNYYCEKLKSINKTRKKTESKIKHIRARLSDNFTADQLKQVMDNVFSNEWMLGNNPKKKMYIEIDNFMCNTEKIEKWLDVNTDAGHKVDVKKTAKIINEPPESLKDWVD